MVMPVTMRVKERGMEDIMNPEMPRKFQLKTDWVDALNDAERPQFFVVQLCARSSSVDMAM